MDKFLSLFEKKVIVPAYILVLLPFAVYIVWEVYWAIQVGYPFIKWHTHFMPFLIIGLLGILVLRILNPTHISPIVKTIFLICSSVFIALFLVEGILVLSGVTKTYMEQVGGAYSSPYSPQDKSYYHLWTPGKPHWITKPEYSYIRPTNSLGFGDKEWHTSSDPHEKRILALGDSFTEGDGAPYDSSYVSLLKQYLQQSGDSFYVMNAGICGSDPFNNFIILKDLLLGYKPNFIIQSLGSGDMNADIILRGGMERFLPDGTLSYRPGPWWEPIYAISYTSRIFFRLAGYDELLRKGPVTTTEKERLDKSVKELFARYAGLCSQNGITCIVVLHPQRDEILANKYSYDFSVLIHYMSAELHIKVVDLLPSYQLYISHHHSTDADYFWQHDGHHNSRGYKMMAETTYENISLIINDTPQTVQ